MVGDTYTQVDSGLSPGQSIVLVDWPKRFLPRTNTTNLCSNLGGGGGAGGFFGGAAGHPRWRRRFPDPEHWWRRWRRAERLRRITHFPNRRTNREMARVVDELTIGLGSVTNRCHRP